MENLQPETAVNQPSLLSILRDDHKTAETLFAQYASLARSSDIRADREGLMARAGGLLRALHEIWEAILCPMLLDGGHATAVQRARDHQMQLIDQLQAVTAADHGLVALDDAVQILSTLSIDGFRMEEAQLFPLLEPLDTPALSHRVAVLRSEMLGHQGAD